MSDLVAKGQISGKQGLIILTSFSPGSRAWYEAKCFLSPKILPDFQDYAVFPRNLVILAYTYQAPTRERAMRTGLGLSPDDTGPG